MKKLNTVKKHDRHGFSQFTLTQNLLNNLQQFEITPTAKLVLLYLSSCYNPKKADMFPKQKTIAAKIGVSERSVVRAISELIQAGLIIVECKYSNRYKFTSRIVAEPPRNEKNFEQENMSDDLGQNFTKQDDKLSEHDIEPINEPINEPLKVDDYKILKNYAIKKGAKNIQAYVNALIKSGSAEGIIKEQKRIEKNASFMESETKRVIADAQFAKENAATELPQSFYNLREQLVKNGARKRG